MPSTPILDRAATGTPLAAEPPRPTGSFDTDRRLTSGYLTASTEAIETLPPRPERSERQLAQAETLHGQARLLRRRFLALHADRVYAELTDGLTLHPRLDRLVELAAERFPGLVPTRGQLAAEARLHQHHKEGWEVDQGLFFHALFDSRTARHPPAALHAAAHPAGPGGAARVPPHRPRRPPGGHRHSPRRHRHP
ncbi:hypothetical protein GCM10020000_76400 [Streptomyces olivoverticillatus]